MAGVEEGGFLSVSTLAISPYYFETTERCLIATCNAHNSTVQQRTKMAKKHYLKMLAPFLMVLIGKMRGKQAYIYIFQMVPGPSLPFSFDESGIN